jgi:geranylgeranyl diphosphate synthase type I
MSNSDRLIERVNAVLARTMAQHSAQWSAVSSDLQPVFQHISDLVLGGGKRLRPQFAYWGWVAAGGEPHADLPVDVGAAIELLHVMALLHDDIIDDADSRRGQPTVHRHFEALHTEQHWAGESRRFGEGAAILAGDLTYVMSDALMNGINLEARAVWHDLRLEMNVGQYLDTLGSARRERRPEIAQLVCQYKSAKYTIERPLHIGALASDAETGTRLMSMLSAYGLPLGEAFQLRDDVLGAFGNSSVTGKPVGGDFHEGKPTPMLAHAYDNASVTQRQVLDLVGTSQLSTDQIFEVQSVVTEIGSRDFMENRIVELRDEAIGALNKNDLNGDAYEQLVALAHAVTNRSV